MEMTNFRTFVQTSLLGGIVVILPVAVLFFVFKWIFDLIIDVIGPLVRMAGPILKIETQAQTVLAHVVVAAIIVALCFVVGAVVRTRLGGLLYRGLENRVLRIAPGYSLVKETVAQVLGSRRPAFGRVALVQLFGDGTLATGFVTDTHPDGTHTVFIPTGPNPTSGFIFHLKAEFVHPVAVPVEKVMRSIISCGVGSAAILDARRTFSAPPEPPGTTPTA